MKVKKSIPILICILVAACAPPDDVPSPTITVPCGDVSALINAINAANQNPDLNTIELAQNCDYFLNEINNSADGNNGLPVIDSEIVVNGNGARILRSESPQDTPKFRLMHVSQSGHLTVNNLTLTKGYAYSASSSIFEGNYGGAILNFGHLIINNSWIIENNSKGLTGGIYNRGTCEIYGSAIDNNNAGSHNGIAINNIEGHIVKISHSSISENMNGDGIWSNGELYIYNTTLSGNSQSAIDNDSGKLVLEYVTIADNGGAILSSSTEVTYSNTIFGENGGSSCNTMYSFNPQGVNFDTDGSCGVTTVAPNSLMLGPLADNGGNTRTHALQWGSVAIDAATGNTPGNDQRGVHRPQGMAHDVGAYEYDGDFPKMIPSPTTVDEEEQGCIYTSKTNLFCRTGPDSFKYPEIDSFVAGETSPVFGFSLYKVFALVEGKVNGISCYVPIGDDFGTLSGECDDIPIMDPVPVPEDDTPREGCTVRQAGGAINCVVPCPTGAAPGNPCTIP